MNIKFCVIYYARIKIFNTLQAAAAKSVKDKKHFLSALKRFLIAKSFYSINDYLHYQHKTDWSQPYKKWIINIEYLKSYILSICFDIELVIVLYNQCFHSIITSFIPKCHIADCWISGMYAHASVFVCMYVSYP
jgi:hypothetical protein